MSSLTVRVFADEDEAKTAKAELEELGHEVEGPAQHQPVSWNAAKAGGKVDGVPAGWVVIARK